MNSSLCKVRIRHYITVHKLLGMKSITTKDFAEVNQHGDVELPSSPQYKDVLSGYSL